MTSRFRALALAPAALCLAVGVAAQPVQTWSQGDPTGDEQAAMEWLNAARRDPVATLGGLLGAAGSDAVITAFLAGAQPATAAQFEQNLQAAVTLAQANSTAFPDSAAISAAPLAFYPLFLQQARLWGAAANLPAPFAPPQRPIPDYLYPTPDTDTLLAGAANALTGPDATGGIARFGPSGGTYSEVAQANLYAPNLTGREYVLSLLCAPGSGSPAPFFLRQGDPLPNLTLGHTRLAGLAVSPAANGARTLTLYDGSSEFFTQSDLPFGNTGTVFITGVAYRDSNGNGVYDAGEGLAGVHISADRGPWQAVTASAGGYALPVPAHSGAYRLAATGGPFAGASAAVTVEGENVKADWILPPAAAILPAQVPVPDPDGACQLIGLSARGLVQTGGTMLVGGFVISGPAAAQKKLLLRGVGPSLQTVGFPAAECLPATQLTVFSGPLAVASNQGWITAADGGAAAAQAAAQAGDFPLRAWAGGGGDSALVLTLPPGAYTVAVAPAAGTPPAFQTGYVGLVEIYDLTPDDGSRLVNLSTRGLAGAGDQGMTAGCTVAGSGHERLLLRAAGPALAAGFGLTGVLTDPSLNLYDGTAHPLAANDDWSLSPQTDQIRSLAALAGAFPFPEGSADAALLFLLPPGSYTAAVSAKAGTPASGLCLVELYETP